MQDPAPIVPAGLESGLTPSVIPVAARIGSAGEVLLLSGYPTQLTIGLLLTLGGVAPRLVDGRLSMTYIVSVWLIDAIMIFALVALLARARGVALKDVLLGSRPIGRELLLGLILVPVVFGFVVVVLFAERQWWPALHNVATNPFEDLIGSPGQAAVLVLMAVVSGGIKEEVQRAFILRRFEEHLGGAWVGLVVFSVLFGAGHFLQGWDVGVVTALLGVFWGVLYLQRRSVAAAAVSHSGFNVAQILQYLVLAS